MCLTNQSYGQSKFFIRKKRVITKFSYRKRCDQKSAKNAGQQTAVRCSLAPLFLAKASLQNRSEPVSESSILTPAQINCREEKTERSACAQNAGSTGVRRESHRRISLQFVSRCIFWFVFAFPGWWALSVCGLVAGLL